jgi:P4 family phage/plasmid primase-like protien
VQTITLTKARARETPPTKAVRPSLSSTQLNYLAGRAVSPVTAERFGLRADGNRIGFPVLDLAGEEVNVRRHLPDPPPNTPKMLNTTGQGSPTRLYPIEVLRDASVDAWVIVGGGELDALAAIDAGLVAVCGTNGELSVPRDDQREILRGRHVAIALDADGAGRKAAKVWAQKLLPLVHELRVVSLPNGTDLNDWFTSGRSAADLLALISSAEVVGARRDAGELLQKALTKVDDGEGRDNSGFWLACQLRDEPYDQEAEAWPILQAFQQAVEADGDHPYTEAAARINLDSAWSRSAREPSKRASADAAGRSFEDGPLAEYVAEQLHGRYAYVSQINDWLHNTGKVWKVSSKTAIVEAVRAELKAVFDAELSRGSNVGQITQLLRRAKIENVAALLRGILETPYGEFDNHPNHLNTPDGVVDLRTGRVEPHSLAYKFTSVTQVSYNPKARSPLWTKALHALPTELHDHVQLLFGQAVTGYPPDHDKVTFLQGGGENGKSSVLDGIKLVLGSFASPVPEKVMLAKPGESVPEMMVLRGKRLVVLEEMPQGGRLSTKRLKDVAGTATLDGRPLYGKTVVWQATHTMFVTSNHRPLVTETDHGTWRRLQMVVFPYRFVRTATLKRGERRGDPALRHHFRTVPEEAVLAWLVAGAMRWYALGMRTPEAPEGIQAATAAWQLLADDVMQFVNDRLVFEKGAVVLASEVWMEFDAWAKQHNKQGWSLNTYAERFEEHPQFKDRGVHHRRARVDNLDVSRPAHLSGPGPHYKGPDAADAVTGKQRIWEGMRWRDSS